FLSSQALFDAVLITAIVHITGGPTSDFSTLYVPLIVVNAVLMTPASTALITAVVGLVYCADVVFGHHLPFGPGIAMQLGLFAVVGGRSAYLVSRVYEMGDERGALAGVVLREVSEAMDVMMSNQQQRG